MRAKVSLICLLSLSACSGIVLQPAEINPGSEALAGDDGFFRGMTFSWDKKKQAESAKVSEPQKETKNPQEPSTQNSQKTVQTPQSSALWRASLEALRIMPLLQVSEQEGSIVTEWLPNPQNKSEEIKIQLFIKADQKDLDVMLFKRKDGAQILATDTSAALKQKILENAGLAPVKQPLKEEEK